MSNKKISEFPLTTSLANSDVFLIDHLGSTSTVSFSTVSQTVSSNIVDNLDNNDVTQKLSTNFIKKPTSSTNGQVLTYNGSTSTWVASAAPKELPSTATSGQVLTYNGSTSTWVASAAFTGTNGHSLTDNGYTILGNGLILQWGKSGTVGVGSTQSVNFVITFPSACLNLSLTIGDTPNPDNAVSAPQYTSLTTSGFTVVNKDTDSSYIVSYFVVGY